MKNNREKVVIKAIKFRMELEGLNEPFDEETCKRYSGWILSAIKNQKQNYGTAYNDRLPYSVYYKRNYEQGETCSTFICEPSFTQKEAALNARHRKS